MLIGQLKQDVAPAMVEYVPAVQRAQALDDVAENIVDQAPTEQSVQDMADAADQDPALHVEHVDA